MSWDTHIVRNYPGDGDTISHFWHNINRKCKRKENPPKIANFWKVDNDKIFVARLSPSMQYLQDTQNDEETKQMDQSTTESLHPPRWDMIHLLWSPNTLPLSYPGDAEYPPLPYEYPDHSASKGRRRRSAMRYSSRKTTTRTYPGCLAMWNILTIFILPSPHHILTLSSVL